MWMMIAAGALSAAAPTYLSCEWDDEDGSTVDLAIDEANQRITIGRPGVEVKTLPALFSPDQIRATERVGSETQTWIIDRSTATLTTTTSFSSDAYTSRCEVKLVPADRVF